jgi:hypothetical protein
LAAVEARGVADSFFRSSLVGKNGKRVWKIWEKWEKFGKIWEKIWEKWEKMGKIGKKWEKMGKNGKKWEKIFSLGSLPKRVGDPSLRLGDKRNESELHNFVQLNEN